MKIILYFSFVSICKSVEIVLFDDWTLAQNICSIAISDAKANGQCTSNYVELTPKVACTTEYSLKATAYGLERSAANSGTPGVVFIGPNCQNDMEALSSFGEVWSSPIVTYTDYYVNNFSPADDYKSMVNTAQVSISGLVESIGILIDALSLQNVSLVGADEQNPAQGSLLEDIKNYNSRKNRINFMSYFALDEVDSDWTSVRISMRNFSKTFVICADFVDPYSVMKSLDYEELLSSGFVVITVANRPVEELLYQPSTKKLMTSKNSFVIAPIADAFVANLATMQTSLSDLSVTSYSKVIWLYNACYTYCVGSISGAETTSSDYRTLFSGKTFTNKYGTFTYDSQGRLLTDYAVYTLDVDNDYQMIMRLNSTAKSCDAYNCFSLSTSTIQDPKLNLDTSLVPQICVYTDTCFKYWFQVYIVILVLFIACLVAAGVWYYRYRKAHLASMTWKIGKDSLKIITNKSSDSKMQKELENRMAAAGNAKTNLEHLAMKKRMFGSYALVNGQRAEFFQFRQHKKIKLTDIQLKHVYNLKNVTHDNITKFIGISFNDYPDSLFFLYTLIERASLEEFALDIDFPMDNLFKSAFIRDICKGLQYLHKSPIKCHGYLLSATCLIDANWVLKLSFFGISNFSNDLMDQEFLSPSHDMVLPQVGYNQFAWFPPEHLKEYDPNGKASPRLLRGSSEGDIYCLGLIIYQMLTRIDPFAPSGSPLDRPGPSTIIDIMNNNKMPEIPTNSDEAPLFKLCEKSWSRDPKTRPSIKNFTECLKTVYPTSKGNLVDQMMNMSRQYANDLEKVVSDRAALIVEAQQQADNLLHEMMPVSIAQQLKINKKVEPRSYACATVMFVQLCDFAILTNDSTPDEIILFLNDIFDHFDVVIKQHDAYKVETTGETYMVASGVPNENGDRHIHEIAEISLKIRDISYGYKVVHAPTFKIRVKIGFHAGAIAAGVIGLKSPRYCLFGDTVNFASRMQSNCPPNQIQTSEQTALLLFQTHEYKLVKRGIVHVKGKGEVNCYWLNEHIHQEEEPQDNNTFSRPATKYLIRPKSMRVENDED
ncbi:unnamed protein product [Caenorhabditis angaria]|uniref:guanylate cyclase n=1 Tax=Caenorhabditis angaria TaxID=860376 RepID=A0A9P1NBG9_9PELO|nr:unnamed protein product [Caenorhabditis angaria]